MAPAEAALQKGGGGFQRQARERALTAVEQKELRETQLNLVPLWHKYKVLFRPIDNGNRIIPSMAEIQEAAKKPSNSSMESRLSEAMIAELFDAEGFTRPYATQRVNRTVRSGYNLLQDDGHMYLGPDVSDKLAGADTILLMTDPNEGTKASVFAIDVGLDPNLAPTKAARGIERIGQTGDKLNSVYWYDTKTKKRGESFDEPKEGKVPAINLAVYVPGEWVRTFGDPAVSALEAHRTLERLGAFAVRQIKLELEVMAMRQLALLRVGVGKKTEAIYIPNGFEVLDQLNNLLQKQPDRYAARAIREGLIHMYKTEAALMEKGVGLRSEDRRLLPEIMQGFDGLEAPSEEALESLESGGDMAAE